MQTYDSYKDSGIDWLGEIPSHWEVVKLKYLCNIYTGYTPFTENKNNFCDDGIIWAKPDNLQGLNYVTDSKEKVSKNAIRGNFLIPKESILLCCIGTIGKMAIAGDNLITNQQINSLVFNKCVNKSFSKFLIYNSANVFDRFSNGNVVKIINTSTQKEIPFPLPPLHEQEAIARFLDDKCAKIDELVAIKEQQIDKLKELRQVKIHQAVTKGINPNVEMKDSGIDWIGEIPKHWEVKSNKYIFNLKKVLVGKNSSKYELLSLTLKGIVKRDLENPEGKFPAEFDSYQVVRKNDFVFCLFDVEETPRTVGLSEYNGMITGAYTVMEANSETYPKFLYYYYLNADNGKKLKYLYKGLRNTIPKESFFSLKTVLPPFSEQAAIAEFLDKVTRQIDQTISHYQNQIEKLKAYKQSLINEVVTGKVKVC